MGYSSFTKDIMQYMKMPRKQLNKLKMNEKKRSALVKMQDAVLSGDHESSVKMAEQVKNAFKQKEKAIGSEGITRISGRFDDAIGSRSEAEMLQDLRYQKSKQHNFGR